MDSSSYSSSSSSASSSGEEKVVPSAATASSSSSSSVSFSSSNISSGIDAQVLKEMLECKYLSTNLVRAHKMMDISKAELSDSDEETFYYLMGLPPYMKAVCVKSRVRNLATKRLLKDLIDAEGAYITAHSKINLKHFPLQTCMIDLEVKNFIANYKREISNRIRFHSVIQGRMKRQYNRVCDLLKGRRGSRGRNSLPPVLQCSLCSMSGDVHTLLDEETAFCLNRDCVFRTCMKCAFKLTDEDKKCPGCRSSLAVFPGSHPPFVISREDYRALHGSLFPEMPLSISQFFHSNTIVTTSNLVPNSSSSSTASSSSSSAAASSSSSLSMSHQIDDDAGDSGGVGAPDSPISYLSEGAGGELHVTDSDEF